MIQQSKIVPSTQIGYLRNQRQALLVIGYYEKDSEKIVKICTHNLSTPFYVQLDDILDQRFSVIIG